MSHSRIRPFSARDRGPGARDGLSLAQAVVARGTTIFLGGQAARDLATSESVGGLDPAAQTHAAMQNINVLLADGGAAMRDLCRLVVYLTDIRHRDAVLDAMEAHLADVQPVTTVIAVGALARPEWLVEIEATAVLPDSSVPAELDPNVAIAAARAGVEAPVSREPSRHVARRSKTLEDED